MKKVFAFMMALAMVLSLSVNVSATDTGSITITNATIGQTYAPYKIFDADISGGENGGFTYTIETSNQFFDDMFGDPTDPDNKFDTNPYFTYNPTTGAVAKKETVADADVLKYLKDLVYVKDTTDKDGDEDKEELIIRDGLIPAVPNDQIKPAENKTVLFDNLDYGYYLITSTLGTMVTINSTDPDVKVIDKNQTPGDNFTKMVWDEDYVDPITNVPGRWVVSSSASIGDIVDFKIEFDATNYNGDEQIKHYTIGDNKGNALWVEFNSIEITVDGQPVGKGWYHCTDNDPALKLNTGEWTAEKNPTVWAESANLAGWYLIHNGYDDFDIIIPWLVGHTFTATGENFTLKYPETNPTSKYSSPAKVVIKYSASVEPTANIDGEPNLFNKADLSWQDETTVTHPSNPETGLTIHALGVTKTDGATNELLSGAVFNVYNDYDPIAKVYSNPVYVIPTDVKGVYILDDLNTIVSGENRETSREKYESYLAEYLGSAVQKNEVVTQLNGKLVILGLEQGTYYLEETVAPSGYNKLTTPVEIVIDGTTEPYTFMTDDDGNVVAADVATKTHTYNKVEGQPVENNKGMELPETGGEGTMKMITIGAIVALVFAILLITNKKMTAYQD